MSMKIWIEQRSAALMAELNSLPFTDDHDLKKQGLIRKAMRDAVCEFMRRASEHTLSDLISQDAMSDDPLFNKKPR
ncbi:hypothetical protein [Permianibacter aggregans]|uniref:Uncharacterized protein n=1 Tax=Permianibacter aggregans TaxID=1510150 RepID=A0A4R6UQ80_9GAMM|nr:hypothetical protein [Permianibacter aggregans]QGX39135.1 hypothetical protein E2H98_05435 [Permianibacter aggregans]TDQ47653.1 hypothetical protein EV696_10957 [Permianibacter aggregans]